MKASGACPVCLSSSLSVYYRDADLLIRRCNDCSVVFLDSSVPDVPYEEAYFSAPYYANYRADYNPHAHPLPLYRFILERLKTHCPPPAHLLEVGCGLGLFLKVAADEGYAGVGVDTSAHAGDYARNVMKVDVRTGRIAEQGFQPSSFDVAVLNDVIEHIRHPHPLLRTLGGLRLTGTVEA